ncbi:unnamed protein product [Sordaria macrospora k-hell]|uniref:WGS project CABT00000000 data, contig 2.38 n=1 Tax=Sordaria macrospora (strain ATCC MYA-333 / DSM 997 / K(L3346) / K-hell) TaxID=771870 RepID=F7W7D2_SORMK|nr:uncharacterized protein SMAC_06921 [Sordaria macrospora k-hell]CCC13423.1 unnamed protein product [Sordaria macrospora k-hell]
MTSRNRQSRNPNRNSASSTQGEEAQLWTLIKDEIRELVDSINSSNDQIRAILAQDSLIAQSCEVSTNSEGDKPDMAALEQTFDTLIRAACGGADLSKQKLSDVIEHVTVLRALTKAREESEGVVHHSVGTPGGAHSSGAAGRDRNSSSLLGSGGRSSSVRGHGGGKGDRGDRGGDREGRETRDRDRGGDKDKSDKGGDKDGKDRDRNSERLGDKLAAAADKSERDKHSDRDLSSMYDFDGAGDSPVPSPLSSHTRKHGGANNNNTTAGSDRASTARDSLPPRDTPSKDSVPPEPNTSTSTSNGTTSVPTTTTAGATQRSKVTFHKGQDVVFKPKPSRDHESTEWMLGRVQQVLGEGKSRRYRVQDADPDLDPAQRAEYRTSASSMIPVPAAGEEEKKLPRLEEGKVVLALYPDSTTFYKAEVMGTEAEGEGEGKERVKLRFEGEETTGTLQLAGGGDDEEDEERNGSLGNGGEKDGSNEEESGEGRKESSEGSLTSELSDLGHIGLSNDDEHAPDHMEEDDWDSDMPLFWNNRNKKRVSDVVLSMSASSSSELSSPKSDIELGDYDDDNEDGGDEDQKEFSEKSSTSELSDLADLGLGDDAEHAPEEDDPDSDMPLVWNNRNKKRVPHVPDGNEQDGNAEEASEDDESEDSPMDDDYRESTEALPLYSEVSDSDGLSPTSRRNNDLMEVPSTSPESSGSSSLSDRIELNDDGQGQHFT